MDLKRKVHPAVYPRWRGEHFADYQGAEIAGGLSPLARGTRDSRWIISFAPRFIPAGAGNTLD